MRGSRIASGWLTSILLALFVIASVVVYTDSIGVIVLCYRQWVAYVHFIGVICYSQWVACTDPLTLCPSQWVACLVPFSFISFTCFASGWPGCSQWVVYAVSFVVLIFLVLDRSVGQRLA